MTPRPNSGRPRPDPGGSPPEPSPGVSLRRALSKLGLCSRKQAEVLVAEGRVQSRRQGVRKPRCASTRPRPHRGRRQARRRRAQGLSDAQQAARLVTTRDDPQERGTVYDCLAGLDLPFVSPAGRLDKASEGLLLMTNDTRFAKRLLDPPRRRQDLSRAGRPVPDAALLARLRAGVTVDGETLTARSIAHPAQRRPHRLAGNHARRGPQPPHPPSAQRL